MSAGRWGRFALPEKQARRDAGLHLDDHHVVAGADFLVELDDVEVAQLDTAGAHGLADALFVVGAVEIDVATVGVDFAVAVYAGFEAAQPEDATGDELGLLDVLGELGEVTAGGYAGFEYHAGRLAGADAFGDFVQAARGAEGVLDVRRRTDRGGNGVAFDEHTFAEELQGGCVDADEEQSVCGLDAEAQTGLGDLFQRRIHE